MDRWLDVYPICKYVYTFVCLSVFMHSSMNVNITLFLTTKHITHLPKIPKQKPHFPHYTTYLITTQLVTPVSTVILLVTAEEAGHALSSRRTPEVVA